MQEIYQFTVKGHIDFDWSEWFDGLEITHMDNGETRLSGPLADQAALFGVLNKVHTIGLPLLSLIRLEQTIGDDALS